MEKVRSQNPFGRLRQGKFMSKNRQFRKKARKSAENPPKKCQNRPEKWEKWKNRPPERQKVTKMTPTPRFGPFSDPEEPLYVRKTPPEARKS